MRNPLRIRKITEPVITPGVADFIRAGRPLSAAPPDTLLLVVGQGFGADPTQVAVHFGAKPVDVFPSPLFSSSQILVSVPRIPPGDTQVTVVVAGNVSNSVPFRIEPAPVSALPPGTVTRRFLVAFDAFAVLLANEIRIADFGRFATAGFREQLIRNVLEARKGIVRGRQKLEDLDKAGEGLIELMEVRDAAEQEKLRRTGSRLAVTLLTLLDEAFDSANAIPLLELINIRIRQGGSRDAAKAMEIAAIGAEQLYHVLEAAESLGASIGVSEGVLVDAEEFPAEAIMAYLAIAAAIIALAARYGEAFTKNEVEQEAEERVLRGLEKLEEKADATEHGLYKLETKADTAGRKADTAESKLDKLERKADKAEGKLDKLERKADKAEGKLDKLERKADKAEGKLDKLEGKADQAEGKLDKLEGKADQGEGKLDKLERKADRAEGKLDKLERKADKAEGKLDKLEKKADTAEGKLDKLETKADKAEKKLDQIEPKLDKLEPKIDKLEPKLDQLEPKIDKLEPKLDQLQVSADQSKEFWQFDPGAWKVTRAKRVGVRVQGKASPGSTQIAFSVESVQVVPKGFRIVKIIVDNVTTDVSAKNLVTPSNVLVDAGMVMLGASRSVKIEFDTPYTGPVEFNGEKPQGLNLCTIVEGPGSSQTSPNPC